MSEITVEIILQKTQIRMKVNFVLCETWFVYAWHEYAYSNNGRQQQRHHGRLAAYHSGSQRMRL